MHYVLSLDRGVLILLRGFPAALYDLCARLLSAFLMLNPLNLACMMHLVLYSGIMASALFVIPAKAGILKRFKICTGIVLTIADRVGNDGVVLRRFPDMQEHAKKTIIASTAEIHNVILHTPMSVFCVN